MSRIHSNIYVKFKYTACFTLYIITKFSIFDNSGNGIKKQKNPQALNKISLFSLNPRPTKGFLVTRTTKGGGYHPPSNFRNEPQYDVYFGTNG